MINTRLDEIKISHAMSHIFTRAQAYTHKDRNTERGARTEKRRHRQIGAGTDRKTHAQTDRCTH